MLVDAGDVMVAPFDGPMAMPYHADQHLSDSAGLSSTFSCKVPISPVGRSRKP
jgi:hypothetical protein